MKILFISDTDKISYNIHTNFKKNGYDSTLLTLHNVENDNSVINISNFKSKKNLWLKHAIRSFIFRHVIFRITGYAYYQDISENHNYYNLSRIKKKLKIKPDIIIILFDYRIVTTKTISELYNWSGAKVIWMMVDMKPMTGGCSYSGDCLKYTTDCNNCPAIGNSMFKNFASKTLNSKIRNLKNVDLKLIAGSSFQRDQTQNSSLFKDKFVKQVFFPLDEKIFNYKNKNEARKLLLLPTNKKILLFGAMRLSEERKGFSYLLDALKQLKEKYPVKDILILIVGDGNLQYLDDLSYQSIKLGFVDYNKLALAYQASDVFICPSIEDSGPIMVNQSIMCGTPVVAFETGVCMDLIKDGQTGYLAKVKDSSSLFNGIYKMLLHSDLERKKMTDECIRTSVKLGYQDFFKEFDNLVN